MKRIVMIIKWCLFIGVIAFLYRSVSGNENLYGSKELKTEITFLNTKYDADCIVIRSGTQVAMIDTGEEVDVKNILDYLKTEQITHLDYLILTHPDKDHIGGAEKLMDEITVGGIFESYYNKEKEELTSLNQKIETKNIPLIYPTRNRTIYLGGCKMIIYPPIEKNYGNDNNYSLVVLLEQGNTRALFTGDALKSRLEELSEMNFSGIDLLKVPYHGRESVMQETFLWEIHPKYAVITAKQADARIKETLMEMKTETYYTGKADVRFVMDANGLEPVEERE